MGNENSGSFPKYESVEEFQDKIDDYFSGGCGTIELKSKDGSTVTIQQITWSGLALFLGFESRQAMIYYETKKKNDKNGNSFTLPIKYARTRIENHYENLLQLQGGSGPIFALKNLGWKDKQEIENKNIDITQEYLDAVTKLANAKNPETQPESTD